LCFAPCNQEVEEHEVPPAYEHTDDSACSFTAVGMTMHLRIFASRTLASPSYR